LLSAGEVRAIAVANDIGMAEMGIGGEPSGHGLRTSSLCVRGARESTLQDTKSHAQVRWQGENLD
jgi:hypothetical protein